ncbi:MAG: hypothetical protein ABEJ56_05680 [Candidatus Nanohaloarchaea archaeon]
MNDTDQEKEFEEKIVDRINNLKKRRNEIARKHGHTDRMQEVDDRVQTLQEELTRATGKQLHEFDLTEPEVLSNVLHDYEQRAVSWDCEKPDCGTRRKGVSAGAYGTEEEVESGFVRCRICGDSVHLVKSDSEDVEMTTDE